MNDKMNKGMEIAEEFGIHSPMVEREIHERIVKKPERKKEVTKDEEEKKLRTKSQNPS